MHRRLTVVMMLVCVCSMLACRSGSSQTELGPDELARLDAIESAIASDEIGRALDLATEFVNDYPETIDSWTVYGRLQQYTGDLSSAREAFERAAELNPDEPSSWHELGNIAVAEQRYGDAVSAYRRGASQQSGPQLWHGLGRAYMEIGETDSARVALEKANELDAGYPGSRAALSELYERSGEIEKAISSMWEAQSLDEESIVYRSELGRLLVIGNRPAEAMVWLEPLLEYPPVRSQTLFAMSRALRQLGREEEANHFAEQFQIVSEREAEIFRLEERVRLNPRSIPDRLSLADEYRKLGDFSQAIAQLLVVERMTEPNEGLNRNLAALYLAAGDSARSAARTAAADSLGR
ncbi:MAG: tetratricopeptide repeat protein [Rhodothermales bacterium]|nr:tetratricopeptide repeat protein [Rhodothermales bacterium]